MAAVQRQMLIEQDERAFVIDGELTITYSDGGGVLLIDECYLSEFVQRHFKRRSRAGVVEIGRVKIIIEAIEE